MKLFTDNKTYNEFRYAEEADFEREVVKNSKLFFGDNSVYVDAKRKIATKGLGGSVPDGFLFDFSDKSNPEFYIVEVELARHDFYKHIFPQITKFFGFFKNLKSQSELVDKLHLIIEKDSELKKDFKKHIGEKEIYKFLKDVIEKSQNILIVIDGDKEEFPGIIETYSDTWEKMVKIIILKKFSKNNEVIYTMHPDFENIDFVDIESDSATDNEGEYDEAYHLSGASETVKKIYMNIKTKLTKGFSHIVFNPQKYYISIRTNKNVAFIKLRKKKVIIVVMNPEKDTRNSIKRHTIKRLAPGVQKFYNGPSCAVVIDDITNFNEVILLLKRLIKN